MVGKVGLSAIPVFFSNETQPEDIQTELTMDHRMMVRTTEPLGS